MCCVICSFFCSFRDIACRTNLFPSMLLPSGYSWVWKMAPWPRSVNKAEEAGILAESKICVRLAQETTLSIEG